MCSGVSLPGIKRCICFIFFGRRGELPVLRENGQLPRGWIKDWGNLSQSFDKRRGKKERLAFVL
jgi:hypothetical protein